MAETETNLNAEIGNIRFEFFTNGGSLSIEAWESTRACRISTYSHGLGRSTRVSLSEDQWRKLAGPVSASGFRMWRRRYDADIRNGYSPTWSISIMITGGWFYSSGDGAYPEGFMQMLRGLTMFASEIECVQSKPSREFLSEYLGGEA